jgi:hypothetical protein
MSNYRVGKPAVTAKEQSKFKTFFRVFSITIALLTPAVAYIIWTSLPPNPVTGRTVDKGFFDPFKTIETDYFSFRVEKTWEEVSELIIPGSMYTYREMQGKNPQGLLQIFINSSPRGSESYYTHVVPIVVKDGQFDNVHEMEPDCNTTNTNKLVQNFMVTQGETTFLCWAGSSQLYSIAGEVGGDDKITLRRANGTTAEYAITYRNLAFTPNDASFARVLRTFKAK